MGNVKQQVALVVFPSFWPDAPGTTAVWLITTFVHVVINLTIVFRMIYLVCT